MAKKNIIAFMNSYSHGISGGDTVFLEIAKGLQKFNLVVVTSYLGKKLCLSTGLKAKYIITSDEKYFDTIYKTYIFRTLKAIFMKISIQKHDLFLGTSDFFPDVLPVIIRRLRYPETHWIQHVFHLIPKHRKISFLSQRISLFLIKHYADLVIIDNNQLKKDLLEMGFENDRLKVNYPGINHQYLSTIKKTNLLFEGVFMAQLRPAKGIDDLVNIWVRVVQKIPNAKLAIIGKGNSKVTQNLKKKINAISMNNNIFLMGYLPDDEAFKIIKSSKIFVFPSHEEGFGITPLEAQALGIPVVAWNLPVFREIFKDGMIKICISDIDAYAKEIIKLLINEEYYRNTSRKAVYNAAKYDWKNTAKNENQFIQKLIK